MSAAVRCVIPLQIVSAGQSPSSCCCCDDRSNPDVYRSGQDGERTDFIPNSSASGSRRTHGPDRQRPASKTFIPRKPLYNNCWTTPRCYTNTIMSEQHGTAPSSRTANVRLGARSTVSEFATLGYEYVDDAGETVLGADATVRSGSIVYAGVRAGDGFTTGHNVLVREHTELGDDVLVGTNSVVDGETTVGSHVSLQSNVYVPQNTEIGDNVFIGPGAVLTNDPHPVREDVELEGPTIADSVSIGANATVLPGVSIGEGSFVAAGAVVCEDVPPQTLAVGVPAEQRPLPEKLAGPNTIA